MRLIASRDLQEPDLAHIESPFFAGSKIRQLQSGSLHRGQLSALSSAIPHAEFPRSRCDDTLLRGIEEGNSFLIIRSTPGPFQPPVRWQTRDHAGAGHWIVDESIDPRVRLQLEQAIARIERDKPRRHTPAIPASTTSRIEPITGTPFNGMLKRYANLFDGNAFPQHLTAAEEKSLGSMIRNLYDGNDTTQNQADIAAYNNKPSMFGVTHGQIFDAMENTVAVLGLLEGGFLLSRLGGAGRTAETVSCRPHDRTSVDEAVPTRTNGGSVKADSRGYLSEVETTRIPNQQSDYTCGPACGVAELKKYGVDISEAELADLAGTMSKYGTDPTRLAEALNKKLPASSSIKYRGGYLDNNINNPEKIFDELTARQQWIMQTNSGSHHYIVIDKINDGIVTVLDPWRFEKPAAGNGLEATITKDKLLEQWINGDLGFIYPTSTK